MRVFYIYIMASQRNGTIYVGVTNNLLKRVYQHRNGLIEGFTKENKVNRLVYFEEYADIREALPREKQLKRWKRKWKVELIEKNNPTWRDLYNDLLR